MNPNLPTSTSREQSRGFCKFLDEALQRIAAQTDPAKELAVRLSPEEQRISAQLAGSEVPPVHSPFPEARKYNRFGVDQGLAHLVIQHGKAVEASMQKLAQVLHTTLEGARGEVLRRHLEHRDSRQWMLEKLGDDYREVLKLDAQILELRRSLEKQTTNTAHN